MLPGGVGVGLLLLALVPGWLYLRLRERLRPPSGATGLTELLEVLAVGLATTGAGAAILAFVPHRWLPFLLDIDAWTRLGNDYLLQHIRSVVASVVVVFLVAVAIAYLLYLVQRLQLPAEFRPQGSVWVHALGPATATIERKLEKIESVGGGEVHEGAGIYQDGVNHESGDENQVVIDVLGEAWRRQSR